MVARQGATMIVLIGVAAMDRRLGLVHGGAATMSVHIGGGVSTTVVAGKKGTETIKQPRATISPGRFCVGFARRSGASERFEPRIASRDAGPVGRWSRTDGCGAHRRLMPTARSSTLHMITQEGTMQEDRERFSRAAAITAVSTLGCTIGVLYLPLVLR